MIITIGCPIESRRWCLDWFWGGITNLVLPPESSVYYTFALRDQEDKDGTNFFLQNKKGSLPNIVDLLVMNKGNEWPSSSRPYYSYEYLARSRNAIMKVAFEERVSDYLLMIDSDILMEPTGLMKLLELAPSPSGRYCCSAPVRNSPSPDIFNLLVKKPTGYGYHRRNDDEVVTSPRQAEYGSILHVDLSGACALIPRGVYMDGSRYYGDDNNFHANHENDNYVERVTEDVGFSRAIGNNWRVRTDIKTKHWMDQSKSPLIWDPLDPERIYESV